ncbi:hypothetical protein EVAR_19066_1 [Eumeta japonica]|uniref:Uncharacterized protein n=1 Tax=Eumeta variegata TaxID=151549 RepID=A0A4C1UP49_EUMVA|nr:hypothetical protein EVAR_19066_1 [Eumeta japonica]
MLRIDYRAILEKQIAQNLLPGAGLVRDLFFLRPYVRTFRIFYSGRMEAKAHDKIHEIYEIIMEFESIVGQEAGEICPARVGGCDLLRGPLSARPPANFPIPRRIFTIPTSGEFYLLSGTCSRSLIINNN